MEIEVFGDFKPRAGHCAVANESKNKLMVFGGLNAKGFLDSQFLEIYLSQSKISNFKFDEKSDKSTKKIKK